MLQIFIADTLILQSNVSRGFLSKSLASSIFLAVLLFLHAMYLLIFRMLEYELLVLLSS